MSREMSGLRCALTGLILASWLHWESSSTMESPMATSPTRALVSFRDGLGERTPIVESTAGDTLEALVLASNLASNRAFVRSLRDRVGRLADFRHPSYARIWRVDGEAGSSVGIALVSERPRGARLADMLQAVEEGRAGRDLRTVRSLVDQLVSAMASLHLLGADVAHGTLGPERIIVTPHGRLVIVEHVLGPGMEQLELARARLWRDYRVAIPPAAGTARLDQRADTLQIGVVALSLILGRRLRDDEFPEKLPELVDEACQVGATDRHPPVTRAFGVWLVRALQLDLRHSFRSAVEAQANLDALSQDETRSGAVRIAAASQRAPSGADGPAGASPSIAVNHGGERMHLAGLEPGSFAGLRELSPAWAAVSSAGRMLLRATAILAAVSAVVGLAYIGAHRYAPRFLPDHQPTVVTVGSNSPGAEVIVDGRPRGSAPAELSIEPGSHTIELRPVKRPRPPTSAASPPASPSKTIAQK
jgi:hypothetical protein